MQHPTIALVVAHAKQKDSERGLGSPDRMARLFPEPVQHKDKTTHTDRMAESGDLR